MNTNLYEKVVNEKGEEIYKPYDITKTKICGRSLQEVIDILSALDIEKEYQIEMTMKHLKEYIEIMKKEQKESFIRATKMMEEQWKNIT